MANTSHESVILNGGGWAVVVPATLSSGKISSLGTAIKHEAIENTEYECAVSSDSDEVVTKELDNGVTLEAPKITKTMSAVTGAEKAASGDRDKIRFTTVEVDHAAMLEIQALIGVPCFIGLSSGTKADGSNDGLVFMYGKLSSSLTHATKGNEIQGLQLEFSGTEGVADTGFDHTDVNTAFTTTVEPLGADAAVDVLKASPTTNHLDAGDLTDLLTGKIVLKASS